MERYTLEEIMSANDAAGLWVTLGFTSGREPNDVLHIVSDEQAAAMPEDERLYLERFDQSYACDGGAELVRVRPDAVEVHLTHDAQAALGFSDAVVVFEVPPGLVGYAHAVQIFRGMARAGRRVEVEGIE